MGQLKTSKINKKSAAAATLKPDLSRDIAIIGLSCQFPDAKNADEYWDNLVAGKNSISVVSKDRWDPDLYYSKDIHAAEKSVSKWGGFIDKIDLFDNQFFGISGREARAMDPQQRLLLEKTFHAIEDAGVSLKDLQKVKTSVYMGVMAIDYYKNAFASQTDNYTTAGSSTGILANRISFAFGLEGASMTIDTACASSLCALHEGRASILSGVHEYSLVGGVTLNFQPWKYISFSKARMLSPDGQCKTFDKSANGYVPGEGIGVLLLCSLDKALERGHHIYGVVKGTAMNHTGPSQALTAPRVEAQREVIRAALKDARVGAETISYVEAHGTGTSLGDPIEIEALTQTFREDTGKVGYCGIGSVKTNIGHLEAAAGVASIVKVLMMFKHRQIPRTLNLNEVNPIIDFASSPFKLAQELSEWKPVDYPLRRAGISSFGFGGVNAHTILEEVHPDLLKERAAAIPKPAVPQILSLSSKTSNGLLEEIAAWEKFFDPETLREDFASICLTSNQSRSSFEHRAGALVDPSKPANEIFAALKASLERKGAASSTRTLLALKPLTQADLAAFESLYRRYSPLAKHFDVIEKEIKLRENKNPDFASFAILYAVGKTLSERIRPEPILTGSGVGYLVSLVVAGALRAKDAASLLEKKSLKAEVEGLQPSSPVFDPIGEKIIHPLRADTSYLKELFRDFKVTPEVFERHLRLAKPLLESQFTFKKLVGEWDALLASRGTSFETMLAGKMVKPGEQRLFIVIVKAALS
ncbi:MAG: polyketide synthase, partial [Spirochaetia bacterium]|nr:polyketide synthase [Spirochaetia bacterium]